MGIMAIIFGGLFIFGSLGNPFNAGSLVAGIIFVLIGFEIVRYSQKESHYNIGSKAGES